MKQPEPTTEQLEALFVGLLGYDYKHKFDLIKKQVEADKKKSIKV